MATGNRHHVGENPGVPRINKLKIIQLLESDLNQVLRSAFAQNISKLAQDTPGIISEHQYGLSHQMCLTPVLNKLLTVQLFADSPCSGRRANHANGHIRVPILIRCSGRREVTPAYSHPGCPATHFIDRSIYPKQAIRYHPRTHATC
jgi:hypothetical protein